jgi:peptidoglycan/xylan/chitin deacetylase (PgdA/CDA1 family)
MKEKSSERSILMQYVYLRFPNFRSKALTLSYDDGVKWDRDLIEIMSRYGLKGTFNLNSGLMKTEFSWVHENGMTVTRLPETVVCTLYDGHEVASHTCTHPYMENLSKAEILGQMGADRFFLEKLLGREVKGFAVPFEYYSPLIAECAREVGFEYARISEETNGYILPDDPYWWRGGKFHWDEDLEDYVEEFLKTDEELALCQIVGHSYDLDAADLWGKMEEIFRRISENQDIVPMTHIEIVRYIRAMEQAVIGENSVYNPSTQTLWFHINGVMRSVAPGETI